MSKQYYRQSTLELLDYRRRISEAYAAIRAGDGSDEGNHRRFRDVRNELFANHSQSPLRPEQRHHFQGLSYYPYDPGLRFEVETEDVEDPERIEVDLRDDGRFTLRRFARVGFRHEGQEAFLNLYWIEGYGGGLFLPFRDATNGVETYGGGRYLLDTIKGADLGSVGGRLTLDFNYAYNPSCAYDERWDCPLAPPENWLSFAVTGGEKAFLQGGVEQAADE